MSVKKYDRPERKSRYGVMWRSDGKRKFKFFESRSLREDFFKEMQRKERQTGRAILDLSSDEAVIMKRCVALLGSPEKVLLACQSKSEESSLIECTAAEAVKLYLQEKQELGRDRNYYRGMRNILDKVMVYFPDDFSRWSPDLPQKWRIELSRNFKPVSVKNYIKGTSAFCNWCVRRKYLSKNIFDNVDLPDVITPEPGILTVSQMQVLFDTAVAEHKNTVAYLAMGAFAGLRSSACARLDIEALDFANKGLLIRADQAKNKRRVYLDGYEGNLWLWLEWARLNAPEGFSLTKRQWDRFRGELAASAGVKMPHNALRHSFCSYHVALHGDAGRTATLLTHKGNVSILYEHYRGNATKAHAEQYFSINPER